MFNSLEIPWTLATRFLCPWDFPGKNTSVGCHFLLQKIFPTQASTHVSLCLLHWRADSLPLVPPGKPHPPKTPYPLSGTLLRLFSFVFARKAFLFFLHSKILLILWRTLDFSSYLCQHSPSNKLTLNLLIIL